MKSALAVLLVGALTLNGQVVSAGLRVGLPVAIQSPSLGLDENTSHLTAGLMAELHLVSTWSFEADALMRKYSFAAQVGSSSGERFREHVTAWDFPLLLKYRLPKAPTHPFVDLGCSLTHQTYDAVTLKAYSGNPPNGLGPVAGVGIELRYRRTRFGPELRYSHLSRSPASQSRPNLMTLLLSITF